MKTDAVTVNSTQYNVPRCVWRMGDATRHLWPWFLLCSSLVRANEVIAYRTEPNASVRYEYQMESIVDVSLPLDATFQLAPGGGADLAAKLQTPILGLDANRDVVYPIAQQFPLWLEGTSYENDRFSGQLLDTQYIFDWHLKLQGDGTMLWSGTVGWTGGRYEMSFIDNVRLVPFTVRAGDANLDGQFDSSDLVFTFQRGAYEDDLAENVGWSDGDWNGDGAFDSADLIVAFQGGGYEPDVRVFAVPEPSGTWLCSPVGAFFVAGKVQKRVRLSKDAASRSSRRGHGKLG